MTKHLTGNQANVLKILIAANGVMEREPLKEAYAKVHPGGSVHNRLNELERRGYATRDASNTAHVTAEGLREYKLQCGNRFDPEFCPPGWRAMKPLREDFPHSKFQVTGTGGHSGDDGEVTCWMEVHRWHRTNFLGLVLPPKRVRFFRFTGKFPNGNACGFADMTSRESVQQMLAKFEFTEILPA